jgi:hypothetical protein
MHACKNNCWFSANKTHCSPCDRKKKEQAILDALSGNSLEALIRVLKYPIYAEILKKNDTLDNVLRKIYIINKDYLEFYLHKIQGTAEEANLISRIHTHSNTYLCAVVGWMIRKGFYDPSINICCLRCMIHLMRYGKGKEADALKYSIQFDLYGPHHINLRAAIVRNKSNLPLIIDMANAILESECNDNLLHAYNNIVCKNVGILERKSYSEMMKHHPLLHRCILELGDTDDKKDLYLLFRTRKDPYWEELIAKGMHPCRVMQWCMTEDEKEGFSHIPDYIFADGCAEWNIEL